MDRPTESHFFHFLCRKRQNREDLSHDLPKQQGHIRCERNRGVAIETLKEGLNPLEEDGERFIACDNIFHRLGGALRAHTPTDMKVDKPREAH